MEAIFKMQKKRIPIMFKNIKFISFFVIIFTSISGVNAQGSISNFYTHENNWLTYNLKNKPSKIVVNGKKKYGNLTHKTKFETVFDSNGNAIKEINWNLNIYTQKPVAYFLTQYQYNESNFIMNKITRLILLENKESQIEEQDSVVYLYKEKAFYSKISYSKNKTTTDTLYCKLDSVNSVKTFVDGLNEYKILKKPNTVLISTFNKNKLIEKIEQHYDIYGEINAVITSKINEDGEETIKDTYTYEYDAHHNWNKRIVTTFIMKNKQWKQFSEPVLYTRVISYF